ncbi:MAG: OsmC family protein [Deltaproteobacteria bacterium]|nr:OsmC family protein [Deltaproteobacteria bacterium]
MSEAETIVVKVKHLGNLQNQIITKNHTIITDEPEESGGDELAANPVELLLGAEGACTISVLMMFAKRMKYDLRNVEINLIHKRVRVEELKEAGIEIDNERGYVHKIEKNIKFIGNLDDDQLEELQRVSKRCPVHNMIEKRSYFEVSFDHSLNAKS